MSKIAELNNSILSFSFDYDPIIINDIKNIVNSKYNSELKTWSIELNSDNIKNTLEICKNYNFTCNFNKQNIIDLLKKEKHLLYNCLQNYKLPSNDYLVYIQKISDNKLFAIFNYAPMLVEEIKEIPNIKFIKNSRRIGWEINIDLDSIPAIIKYINKSHVYFKDLIEYNKYLKSFSDNSKKLAEQSKAIELNTNFEIKGLAHELRPFQKVCVKYALKTKYLFIADDMGCGKTIEALATFQASNSKKCLIVCPASVKYNWLEEAQKWLPSRKSIILTLSKDNKVQTEEINIINYNMLTKISTYINNDFDMFIFDESHRLKSKNTQWSKTSLNLTKSAKYCLLLSGTPVLNRPADLIHQLNIIGRLSLFGGEWKFKQKYCDLKRTRFGWDYSGASNLEDLHDKLISTCYIRRTKDQVLKELPTKQRSYIPIVLSNKEYKIYNEAEENIADWIVNSEKEIKKYYETNNITDKKSFEYITKMKVARAETLIKISKLRQIVANNKITSFCDWAEDFMTTGKKLIIFAIHKEIISAIQSKLDKYGVVIINGEVPIITRQENIKKFQNDNDTKIIICNIQSGGVGLTLTAASDVAFLEFGWTIAEHLQAEDRAYRIGQTNSVNIWYFYCKDTIDLDFISLLQSKEKIINAITDGENLSALNDSSIVKGSILRLMSKHKKTLIKS